MVLSPEAYPYPGWVVVWGSFQVCPFQGCPGASVAECDPVPQGLCLPDTNQAALPDTHRAAPYPLP